MAGHLAFHTRVFDDPSKDMPMSTANPLLNHTGLVDYDAVTLAHIVPAIDQVITEHETGIERIIQAQQHLPTWDDLVLAVDVLDANLQGVFYSIAPLVFRGGAWQTAVNDCFARVDARFKQKLKNARLCALYERLASSAIGMNLDAHQRTTLQLALKAFRLAGADLDASMQQQLEAHEQEIRRLESAFIDNVAWSVERSAIQVSDEQQLVGVPHWLRAQWARQARDAAMAGWLVDCDEASFKAVLEHATDRELRERVYRAYQTRGWTADVERDNGLLLQKLADARDANARLLGFDNHLQLSVQTKSAGTVEQVRAFLDDLAGKVRPVMLAWQARMQGAAQAAGLADVQPWDIAWLQASTRTAAPAAAMAAFRDYYPLDKVLQALAELAQQLFGVTLQAFEEVAPWDPSVRTFEVLQDHARLGYLYLDAVQHGGKQSNSVFTLYLRTRRIDAEGLYHGAVAAVFSDIPAGSEGTPPLLDPLDLRKLFHEYGHALHHLLLRTGNHLLSDLRRLGTDGVEVSGKLLERWAWDASYLASISSHHQSGAKLAQREVQQVLAALQGEGIQECAKILSQALFDFDLHGTPADGRTIEQRVEACYRQTGRWPLAEFERPMHAFEHLVTGYDAGFYAYLWSDVQAFDLFSRFEKEGLLNARTGQALQAAFFAPGGARPLADSAQAFLGRPVSPMPYLRWHGLDEPGGA